MVSHERDSPQDFLRGKEKGNFGWRIHGIGVSLAIISAIRVFPSRGNLGGGAGIRTPDPLLAKQVLSRLSYTPISSAANDRTPVEIG